MPSTSQLQSSNISGVVEFRNPPKSRPDRPGHPWHEIAAQLKAMPGKWAHVGNGRVGLTYEINRGLLRAFPEGEFEATSRHRSKNRTSADLYVRYVGADTATPSQCPWCQNTGVIR